ncbi:hypothetical protein WOSG25_010820 [Weissella oryzae SG25]|uniref:Protein from nitrogen regulatory protein P-II (GLNB) family n=1 Tax=Weissella oryzae (strain DSM 25784 / JCM 18191 / LMG 30913 / SG25) TaxID=1329250 RepID=A0A069CQN4_WEIOS|nr:cyclic-di-AMP receptor [Weissella oryzae]GAK29995.1 hypothetical protein WOSG25_010820 [Weissella oryzae SG25]
MKMVTAIVQDKDVNQLSDKFVQANIQATRLRSSGGFLRSGNTTFMIGVEDDQVAAVLDIIKTTAQTRKQIMTPTVNLDMTFDASMPVEVQIGGATVFVQDVAAFYHF